MRAGVTCRERLEGGFRFCKWKGWREWKGGVISSLPAPQGKGVHARVMGVPFLGSQDQGSLLKRSWIQFNLAKAA